MPCDPTPSPGPLDTTELGQGAGSGGGGDDPGQEVTAGACPLQVREA